MMAKSKVKSQKSKLQFKMQNFTFFLALLPFYFLLLPCCYSQPLSSTELINNAKSYDGKTVVYEGEVIGDIMVRGAFAWINVNDGKNAIGIWLEKDLSKDIFFTEKDVELFHQK